uniref:UMOD/GP2/OIT3-like D8C domain-containing protein n=1 Tax=Pygocentrus nattereri TaxID=42514 RepID=A0AAR2JEU5_PYGNA
MIGVGVLCPVVVTLHFSLVDLILDYRTISSPETFMDTITLWKISVNVIPTNQTQSRSKPVQEITTSTDSSSQLYQFQSTNATVGLRIWDRYFNWNGWYRLLYNGMSARMPESCVNPCGTDVALWLNGSHPQIKDGIVTRLVCGSDGSDCCYYRSTPIKVKACPGNYYVYEFVKPSFYYAGYCAGTGFY